MITKLHIDALVASKIDLYRSSEHYKHINLEKMQSAIRAEIESLCGLADQEVCLDRCNHFDLKGTVPSDYRERIIYLDENLYFLAGIRFQGLDITKPFISVHANFYDLNENLIFKISELVKNEFKDFQSTKFSHEFSRRL